MLCYEVSLYIDAQCRELILAFKWLSISCLCIIHWFSLTLSDDPVSYTIVSGDPNGYFMINSQTGAITTNADLDHDSQPSVLLNIQAQSGNPPNFGSAQVSSSNQLISLP